MLGNFSICCRLRTFFKINFFHKILSEILSGCQNGLDPDHFELHVYHLIDLIKESSK